MYIWYTIWSSEHYSSSRISMRRISRTFDCSFASVNYTLQLNPEGLFPPLVRKVIKTEQLISKPHLDPFAPRAQAYRRKRQLKFPSSASSRILSLIFGFHSQLINLFFHKLIVKTVIYIFLEKKLFSKVSIIVIYWFLTFNL